MFKAVPASGDGSLTGVQVKQIEQTNAAPISYDPGHPLADADGYVYAPGRRPGGADGQPDFRLA